jgi:hypothetical protein
MLKRSLYEGIVSSIEIKSFTIMEFFLSHKEKETILGP